MKPKAVSISPVINRLDRLAAVDRIEVAEHTSHKSAQSFGSDARNLRTSPAETKSFGTRLADSLVAACLRRKPGKPRSNR
jgi:hypothetical protein